jgi:CDP-glycerol glycerophosphotransferase
MISKILKYAGYILMLPLWWFQRILPRDKKLWVFGAWYGLKYSDNARAMFEYVSENRKEINCIWLTRDPCIVAKLQSEGKKSAMIRSLKGIYYSIRAGFVIFSSGKLDVNPFFINGAKIVNTWHGVPMKKICLDDKFVSNHLKLRAMKFLFPNLYEYNISNVVSTADLFTPIMGSAFGLSQNDVICSGYPRNDILYSSSIHPLIKDWNEKYQNPVKMFYLPTFRDLTKEFKPFENYGFNESLMNQFLSNSNSILISKGHFVDKEIGGKSHSDRIIHLSDSQVDDLNFILKNIDILITDYSGVYFDFLLTQKKILFAPFDLDEYLNKHRELYFKYDEIICGPVAKNWEEVISGLNNLMQNDQFSNLRVEKNIFFNKFQDGKSSSRLYEELIALTN